MDSYEITDAEKFFDAVRTSKNEVRVVRTYASQVVEHEDGKWHEAPFIRCLYRVGVKTTEGPALFRFTEYIPVEVPSGLLRTAGTMWRRIKDAKLPLYIEMLRSGAL